LYKIDDVTDGFFLSLSGSFEIISRGKEDAKTKKIKEYVNSILSEKQIIGLDEIALEQTNRVFSVRWWSTYAVWIHINQHAFYTQLDNSASKKAPMLLIIDELGLKTNLALRKNRLSLFYKNSLKLNKPRKPSPPKDPKTGETYLDYINRQRVRNLLVCKGILKKGDKNIYRKYSQPKNYADRLSMQFADIFYHPEKRPKFSFPKKSSMSGKSRNISISFERSSPKKPQRSSLPRPRTVMSLKKSVSELKLKFKKPKKKDMFLTWSLNTREETYHTYQVDSATMSGLSIRSLWLH
jgi:hypothetical protein